VATVAVELDRQAQRDLRKLHPDDHRAALRAMADVLTHEPLPANANDRALVCCPGSRSAASSTLA
jgi:hypothetical protein